MWAARHPPRARIVPLAVVIPRIIRVRSPSGVLPLRPEYSLGGLCRPDATDWHRRKGRLRRLAGGHLLDRAHRAAARAERPSAENRPMHRLLARAAGTARAGYRRGLDASRHQRSSQSLRGSIHGGCSLRAGGDVPGCASSPEAFNAIIASMCSACLFNRNRPAIRDCSAA